MSSASSQKSTNKSLNIDAVPSDSPTPDLSQPNPSQPDLSEINTEHAESPVDQAPHPLSSQLSENSIPEDQASKSQASNNQVPASQVSDEQEKTAPLASGIAHFLRQITQPNPSQAEEPSAEPLATHDSGNDFGQLGFAGIDIRQMAAEGYFQAIAYWLNEPLIPQQVYAQVLADDVPGRLKVLIEFERAPQPQRLIRFVCDRLYKLNSNAIEGVHLITRALGTAKTDWEKSIRIPTATQRQNKTTKQRPLTSPLPHSLKPPLLHESTRIHVARQAVRSQFKFFRAALVTGTAAAAFLFGGVTELVLSEKLSVPTRQNQDITPWYGTEAAADFDQYTQPDQGTTAQRATNVSFRPASRFRGRTVEAALETVAISPHDDVANPSDPTITLLFGGELNLNHFNFAENEDLDNLFSEIDIYQEADVAMVGLGEPLANASTSLQEDFYQRTRPQAVKTLKTGGIDIVGLAGEGNLTYGARGLGETLTNLDRQGIYRVGAGRNQREAHRPEILEVKGQRIAYLGYNPDAAKGAKAEKAGVALTTSEERKHIIEDIKAIRSQVDWIVVNYRWGNTLAPPGEPKTESATPNTSPQSPNPLRPHLSASIPEDWQKSLAREAVDAGADLVVGYHPKNLQGVEIYHDRAIAYSLGDFVFGEAPLENHDSAALRVSLRNQQMKVEFLPVTIRESKLQMATGDHGAAILQTIRNASRSFEQPMRFPAVLDAKPNRYLPESLHKNNPAPTPAVQSAPAYESDEFENETPAFEAPAPNPRLQESEALFIPAEAQLTEEKTTELENPADLTPLPEMVPEEWLSDGDEPQPWEDPWEDESLLENALEHEPGNMPNGEPESTSEQEPEQAPLESNLEAWGEKNTDTDSAFEPIPAGSLQRQQRGDAPEEISPRTAPPEEIWFDDLENNSDAHTTPIDAGGGNVYEDTHTPPISEPISEAETTQVSSGPRPANDVFSESAHTSVEIIDTPAPGVIAPYEEPLVGPLSALPESHITTEKTVPRKPVTAVNPTD
ncbi:MAG: CapA family protein [Cyanobacteria bacterium J06598_3]